MTDLLTPFVLSSINASQLGNSDVNLVVTFSQLQPSRWRPLELVDPFVQARPFVPYPSSHIHWPIGIFNNKVEDLVSVANNLSPYFNYPSTYHEGGDGVNEFPQSSCGAYP